MIPLTPERLAAVYECLSTFPPFNRLKIPPAEEIKFSVLRTRAVQGDYSRYVGTDSHILRISAPKHGHFDSLAATVAHEMLHVHQARAKTETRGEHNAEFKKLALRVCRVCGFDYGQFL
jgi:hypothetical protein